jgi:sulfite exporter TauE/SafE
VAWSDLSAISTGLLLGLAGSLGHCTGMCGGVSLLLTRGRPLGARSLMTLHLGRVSTYMLLGLVSGAAGGVAGRVAGHAAHAAGGAGTAPGAPDGRWQGLLALAAAGVALYFALALLGRVRSPDVLLAGLSRHWAGAVRATTGRKAVLFEAGLVWGLLPCGLVLTALLTAAVTASPAGGFLTMGAFGAGTLPAHLALALAGHRLSAGLAAWPRRAAAFVAGAFGAQLALRGLAALGRIDHFGFGQVALW